MINRMKAGKANKHIILLAITSGAFLLVLTNSAFNVLLPEFVRIYNISAALGGWMITLYMLAMTMTMPLTTLIVDRIGRKRAYIMGLAVYCIFSIMGGLFYKHIEAVLLVRLMHGAAAGLMIPLSLVLLFDHYGHEMRGRITGLWGMLLMVAPAIGPTLGGLVMEFGEIKYLFWINVPFALCSLILCCTQISSYQPARRKTLYLEGVVLMLFSIFAMSMGIHLISVKAVSLWLPVALMLLGTAAGVRFIQKENGRTEPLIRYRLLEGNPVYAMTVFISAIQDSVMFGVIFVLPLLLQEVFHFSPAMTGAIFIPAAIFTSVFSWVGGSLVDKGRSLNFIAYGIVLIAGSVLVFAFFSQQVSFIVIALMMAARGMGNGLSSLTITTVGLNSLPEEDLHEGSVLSSTIERLMSSFAVMLLAVYYEVRWQAIASAGKSAELAKWLALKEECFALGILMLATLPLVLVVKRKKVAIDVGNRRQSAV